MASIRRFIPGDFQVPLEQKKFIIEHKPEGDDVVPFDVVFVGAGPAGLAGAIELAKLVKADGSLNIEIGVLEKAGTLGGHSLSGAVINPISLQTLFPDMPLADFPFRHPVKSEKVMFMTKGGAIPIPTPPTMKNHGFYIGSLCEVVRWLGQRAEELGVNIMTGFPVDSLLSDNGRIVGVRTTPAGLKRDGSMGPNAMPATDIAAKVVTLSDGTRSPLAQSYIKWKNLEGQSAPVYALGVKEIWKVKKAPDTIVHTLGWPLPNDCFGGSFLYPMAQDQVAIGLVAGLDYRNPKLDVHLLLQHLKEHSYFKQIFDGGQCMEWGSKTIPEGGFHALPKAFTGDGFVMSGDAVGLVNVPALKGVHYAMMSGILAARAIFKALKNNDTTASGLESYDLTLKDSFIWKDLKKVRNMRHAFKGGFYSGGIKAALMTVTDGIFPGDGTHTGEDSSEWKEWQTPDFPTEKVGISKVDAVYMSSNKTRDDIPQHLIVGKDISGDMADFYAAMCPAGVYERRDDTLVVNAPNCVDCKATDVLGPRWTPREGGSGPDYKEM